MPVPSPVAAVFTSCAYTGCTSCLASRADKVEPAKSMWNFQMTGKGTDALAAFLRQSLSANNSLM